MKRSRSKLTLNVETVRSLTDEEAASMVGGKPQEPAPCDGGGPTNPSDPGICQGPTTVTGGCPGGVTGATTGCPSTSVNAGC